jgi:hypothetical protein
MIFGQSAFSPFIVLATVGEGAQLARFSFFRVLLGQIE